jgi:hypothetical protein
VYFVSGLFSSLEVFLGFSFYLLLVLQDRREFSKEIRGRFGYHLLRCKLVKLEGFQIHCVKHLPKRF